MTPGQAATKWAKEHPSFAGILEVLSYTRKGKGGWGITTKGTRFYCKGGAAKAFRVVRKGTGGNWRSNGQCEVCGELYLDPCLVAGSLPEPLAGQPVPTDELWRHYQNDGHTYTYAETCYVLACPACWGARGITSPGGYTGLVSWDEKKWRRHWPEAVLPTMECAAQCVAHIVTLDIRE
jgi:hypothetical protein